MDFFSYQLSENKATNYRFTFGYLLKGVKFGFLQGKKSKKKKETPPADPNNPQTPRGFNQGGGGRSNSNPQDLNINCEFSLQDQITINHLLDQDQQEPTRGQKQIRFTPSADYQYNKRLNFRLYVEYTKNIPKTSATPPRTEIYGGITVSFTLN
jgi:cell surface protein SprA